MYGSWINNYLYNLFLSLLMWVRISIRVRCTTLCDKVCQWLATGRWFSLGTPVSSINKTDRHNIVESGVKHHQTNKQTNLTSLVWVQTHWKQQSVCRHITSFGQIIVSHCSYSLVLRAQQRSNKYQFYNLLVWPERYLNLQSTTLHASTRTITPPMLLHVVI